MSVLWFGLGEVVVVLRLMFAFVWLVVWVYLLVWCLDVCCWFSVLPRFCVCL